jgi:hypothetical protein
VIKIMSTGGVLSSGDALSARQFSDEELHAIVDEATLLGLKVCCHAHGAAGIKAAVKAGVASIEHGTFLDDECIRLMKEHGTYLVPTRSAGEWVYAHAKTGALPSLRDPQGARGRAGHARRRSRRPTGRASRSRSAPDAGVFPHGAEREGVRVHDRPRHEADGSDRQRHRRGLGPARLERGRPHREGRFATSWSCAGDPLADIRLLEQPVAVLKGGAFVLDERGANLPLKSGRQRPMPDEPGGRPDESRRSPPAARTTSWSRAIARRGRQGPTRATSSRTARRFTSCRRAARSRSRSRRRAQGRVLRPRPAGQSPAQQGRRFPAVDQGPHTGRRVAVLFEDGELLVGYAQTYSAERAGFFVFPADPNSNNIRVYVLRAATKQIKLGPAADELARTAPPPRPKPKLPRPSPSSRWCSAAWRTPGTVRPERDARCSPPHEPAATHVCRAAGAMFRKEIRRVASRRS